MDSWTLTVFCITADSCSNSSGCGMSHVVRDTSVKKKPNGWSDVYYHQCKDCGNHIKIPETTLPQKVKDYAGSWSQWWKNL
jgi:hypothetical protein